MKTIVIVDREKNYVRLEDYDEKLIEKLGGVSGYVHGSWADNGLGYAETADIEVIVTDTVSGKKMQIWDGRSATSAERAERGAEEMFAAMNSFSFDRDTFVDKILHEHSTLIQTWMKTCVSAMKRLAKQRGTWDDRKKATVAYCAKMEDLGLFDDENTYFPCI